MWKSISLKNMDQQKSNLNRVAFIGSYQPRQCGIATFTTDLYQAINNAYTETTCFAVAVNDITGYDYPSEVRFELIEQDLACYQQAVNFLCTNHVDCVCLQHEYGIYGGPAGSHILDLLRELRMPVVTTLHTILKDPDAKQRAVMEELTGLSDRLVVISQNSAGLLQDVYDVPEEKIEVIPHGINDIPFVESGFYKRRFGIEDKTVLLSSGLLGPDKGIEYVIKALPKILKQHPDVIYIVLGVTHPHQIKASGESYRLSLQRLAHKMGLSKHVRFHNYFVSHSELNEFIGAADFYMTPYLSSTQVSSGTLAYAVGAGKAIISTPYLHAQELLAENRGILVPFGNSEAIANHALDLLNKGTELNSMRQRAYQFGRKMTWPKVARRYTQSFERAHQERSTLSRGVRTRRIKQTHLITFAGSAVAIQYSGPASAKIINFLYRHFPFPESIRPHVTFRLRSIGRKDWFVLHEDDTLLYAGDSEASILRLLLNRSRYHLTDRCQGGPVFHAGGLAWHDLGFIIAGLKCNDRSLLTASLLKRGFGYLSDQLVFVPSGSNVIRGFARPLKLNKTTQPPRHPPGDAPGKPSLVMSEVDSDLVLPSMFGAHGVLPEAQVRLILVPNFQPESKISLRLLSEGMASLVLIQTLVNFRNLVRHGLPEIIRLANQIPAYQLNYSHLDQLDATLKNLLHDRYSHFGHSENDVIIK